MQGIEFNGEQGTAGSLPDLIQKLRLLRIGNPRDKKRFHSHLDEIVSRTRQLNLGSQRTGKIEKNIRHKKVQEKSKIPKFRLHQVLKSLLRPNLSFLHRLPAFRSEMSDPSKAIVLYQPSQALMVQAPVQVFAQRGATKTQDEVPCDIEPENQYS